MNEIAKKNVYVRPCTEFAMCESGGLVMNSGGGGNEGDGPAKGTGTWETGTKSVTWEGESSTAQW